MDINFNNLAKLKTLMTFVYKLTTTWELKENNNKPYSYNEHTLYSTTNCTLIDTFLVISYYQKRN